MKIQYIICVLITVLFISCDDESQNISSSNMVNVAVSVTLPQPEPVNAYTRAGSYTDTEIKNIDLLVFDDESKFVERIKIEEDKLVITDDHVSFIVKMDAASQNRIIHLVVNGRTDDGVTDRLNFDDLEVDMSENVAIPLLQTTRVGSGSTLIDHVMPLVMWSRFVLATGVTEIDDVKLLRAAACIQVKKGTETDDNGLGRFVIREVSVYRAMGHGYLTPSNITQAVTPTVGNPVAVINEGDYADYSKGWVARNTATGIASLYVYERNCNAANYMSVIIKAGYRVGGSTSYTEGYYKVVMTNESGVPLNIIRNHRYKITIIGVNGPGYSDVQTAIDSAPSNDLKVAVEDEDPGYTCIVADGEHYMASSNNVFHLYGGTSAVLETFGIELCTVYSSRDVEPAFFEDCAWIDVYTEWIGENTYRVLGDFYHGLVGYGGYTLLTVTCDNLSLDIGINWKPSISDFSSDGDSYVFDLINADEENWNVQILGSPNWIYLHSSSGNPGSYPGAGMQAELSSKYTSHAYLHVGIGNIERRAAVQKSSVVGGEVKVDRIVIAQ